MFQKVNNCGNSADITTYTYGHFIHQSFTTVPRQSRQLLDTENFSPLPLRGPCPLLAIVTHQLTGTLCSSSICECRSAVYVHVRQCLELGAIEHCKGLTEAVRSKPKASHWMTDL